MLRKSILMALALISRLREKRIARPSALRIGPETGGLWRAGGLASRLYCFLYAVIVLIFCSQVHAAGEIILTAYPPLPAENLIRNGGFEATYMFQYLPRITRLSNWTQWPMSQAPNPWGFIVYPDGAATQDKDINCFGRVGLRLQNSTNGQPQFLIQIINGNNYTYTIPRSSNLDDMQKDVALKSLEENLPDDFQDPTHILSCWTKSDGAVPGRIEVFNITTPPARKLIASKDFNNTAWQKINIPFTAPQQGSALMVSLGLARSSPASAAVWYDNVSLIPIHATLEYKVTMPALAEVTVRNKTNNAVVGRSTKQSGSFQIPAQGVFLVEAMDSNGKALSCQYPDQSIVQADSIVVNGGFEHDSLNLVGWKPYDMRYPKFGALPPPVEAAVDGTTFKSGQYSMRIQFSAARLEAMTQQIPAGMYMPGRRYVFSFWLKTSGNGSCTLCLDNIQTTYLVYSWKLSDCAEWKYYRFEFTTPKEKDNDLMVLVMGPRDQSGLSTVWLDDIAVRPLQNGERDACDFLDGFEKDMTEFYRTVIRPKLYDSETALDMIGFSVDDFRKAGIVDEAGYKILREQVDGLVQNQKDAVAKITAFYQGFIKDKEVIITQQKWDESAALAAKLKGWRASWQEMADRILQPLQASTGKMAAEIKPDQQRLADHGKAQERQVIQDEQKSFSEDYRKAVEAIGSADAVQRESGALELGRLGDATAAPALIALLKDGSYPVRRNALYALAWMRSADAVPAIISLVESSPDPWTRRRATQALGMIGDVRAISILKKLVDDSDGAVRQNAIISLGWFREPTAVDMLTRIVRQYLEENPESEPVVEPQEKAVEIEPVNMESGPGVKDAELFGDGENAFAPSDRHVEKASVGKDDWRQNAAYTSPLFTAALAVQSLGLIGDTSAKPLLMKLAEKQKSETSFLMIHRAAIFALGQLGDKEAEPLLQERTKEMFLARGGISREALNALAVLKDPGQPRKTGIQQPEFMKQKRYFYWLDNHFHRAFGRWLIWEENRPGDFAQAMRYAGASDANQFFEWWVPAPLSEVNRYFEAAQENGIRCLIGDMLGENNKDGINRMVHYYGDYPAFAGIWNEEGPGGYLEDIRKRTAELTSELLTGLKPDEVEQFAKDAFVEPEFRWKHREFFARFAQIMEQDVVDGLQESREYLHMLRKGTVIGHYTSVASTTFTTFPATLALWGRMAHNLDINGTEPSYATATYENGMFAEMCRDGGETCNGMEIYIWRLPLCYTRQWETGMGIGLLHAQQFYVWYWGDVFKQMNAVERGRPEAWEITRRMFNKMKKMEPYLINNKRPKDLGLVYSGRTAALLYRDDDRDRTKSLGAAQSLYSSNIIGVYQALAYEHTQCDVIWADTLTPDKVKEYRVLMLPDAKTLTPDEETILREWVRNGGSLIVTGTTTIFDQYGNARTNYGLADVFGVDFITNTCTIPLENIDTGKGVAAQKMGAFNVDGQLVDYDLSYGYDKVSVRTARVLAGWAGTNDAAMTLNTFGKGHCLFLSATYPGMMYTPGRIIYRWPLFKNYFKGVTPMLAGLVRQGLSLANTPEPVLVENCPWYVETYLRLQPEKKRIVFQLLNYDEQKLPVHGVKASVRVPGKVTKVFHAADDVNIKFNQKKGYVDFSVRDFDIHEAVVIELE